MEDLTGMDLGRYRILEQLGKGGMAIVYKAYDTRLEREVAFKIIRTARFDSDMLNGLHSRFDREAKTLAALVHPNIVNIIDYGKLKGIPYLVMEYLPGGTLRQRLNRGQAARTSWQAAARLILPIASALQYAHAQGIIHRDVKPANILFTPSGEPMLTDFGIVKIYGVREGQNLTGTGSRVGTPDYMAPEQWAGQAAPQSDIYSLGAVFYEMVTGHKPHQVDTLTDGRIRQTDDRMISPRQFVPDLPDALEAVLAKALARRIEDRYQTMGAFADALDGLLMNENAQRGQGPEPGWTKTAVPAKPMDTTDLAKRRNRVIGLGAVILTVIVVLVAVILRGKTPTQVIDINPDECMKASVSASSRLEVTECVTSISILTTGEMQFNFKWQVQSDNPALGSMVYTDATNHKMYLADQTGKRIDHTGVGGGAAADTKLFNGQSKEGWFLFPADPQATYFIFHDDDNGLQTNPIPKTWK